MTHPARSSALSAQAIRYLISGGGVVALDFLCFYLLTRLWPDAYVAANVAAKTIGALSGFFLHKHFTFAGEQAHGAPTQLTLYIALYVFNMALSSAIIFGAVEVLGWHELLAKIVADVIVVATSFVTCRLLVFAQRATGAVQRR